MIVGLGSKPAATNGALELQAEEQARVGIVLEGQRAGLPIYCSPFPKLRLDGRVLPERLVLSPETAGLAEATIQWVTVRAGPALGAWQRTRFMEGDNQWSLEVLDFPGSSAEGIAPSWGTFRFAAKIGMKSADGAVTTFESAGWSHGATSMDEEGGAGLRISRAASHSLAGHALSLARLPVLARVPVDLARRHVAIESVDLAFLALESLCVCRLPLDRTMLPNPEWEWLFRTTHEGVRRRAAVGAPLVDAKGRPIAFAIVAAESSEVVRLGDILVAGEEVALYEGDDGDGWLGEGDRVLHTVRGEVSRGKIADLPGKTITTLRLRDFGELRVLLARAGTGEDLGLGSKFPGPEIFRACREFQRDHALPETGIPDAATVHALRAFLSRLDAADSATTSP